MSTKIHNGYRYSAANAGNANPFDLIPAFDAALRPVVLDAYYTRVTDIAANIYDGIDSGSEADRGGRAPTSPLLDAEYQISEAGRKIAATRQRNPSMDFSCEIYIYPDPHNSNSLYLLTNCEVAIRDAMLTIPGVEEYAYWNNTDRPDNLTADEWQERKETWDLVLGCSPEDRRHLTWDLGDVTFSAIFSATDEIAARIPDKASRARRIAKLRARETVTITEEERESGSFVELICRLEEAHTAALADTEALAEIEAGLSELTVDLLKTWATKQ